MATPAVSPDPVVRAHADAGKAIATFLPSLTGRNDQPAPTPPPHPLAKQDVISEATRVAMLAKKGETMSSRVARGLPPEDPQQTPEMMFGNQLDSVHTRAIQEAIARVPEEERGKFISEAHDSTVKWIGAHNGKVIVHGKVELAHSPESAERLAAKIVNNEVEGHDQRKAAEHAEHDAALGRDAAARTEQPDPSGAGTIREPSSAGGGSDPRSNGDATPSTPQSSAAVPIQPAPSTAAISPEVVPPGDGQQPAQGPPPIVKPQEAAKVGTRKDDGHQITQPKPSIAANQKLALDAAPELHDALSTLSQQVPGTKFDRIRPQKSTDRLDQKVEDKNDPDTLSDYLGAQVAADSPRAKDAMIDALRKNFKVIEVDDQFLTGRKDKAQYPSSNVQVQLSNGVTAEVQIVPQEVQDATEQSHQFYKAGRDAEERGDNKERDRQWKQAADINQGALAQFKARNGVSDGAPAGNSPQVPGYEVMGAPITIGKHTFLRVKPGGTSGTTETVDTQGSTPTPPVADGASPTVSDDSVHPTTDRETDGGNQGATPRYAKGDTVALSDGTPVTIAYADPNGRFVRGHTSEGKLLKYVDVKDIASAAAQ